jgi:hypothetical protein
LLSPPAPGENEAFHRFLRRVWREDVTPLLRDHRAAQRKQTARVGGKLAAASGLFVDGLLGLKGKPFTRFMTVMGSSLGAMLPDVWDWRWLREIADGAEREIAAAEVERQAAVLPEADALALFGLPQTASREQLKQAWRDTLQRWHPDKAPDEAARREFHVRFLAHKAAYERLCLAYDAGRLPNV